MVKNIYPLRKCDNFAPKPVHTTAIRHHALFGPAHIRQHMMMDERWRNEDLIDEYFKMAELLKRRHIYKQLEKKDKRKHLRDQHKNLRQQVYEGRMALQKSLGGDTEHDIRLLLLNHKDMQRLYVKMPLHEVEENINQRTFVMRKERDRLTCHLDRLKKEMEQKLMERSHLESRIHFENEYVLQEQQNLRSLHKHVENSQTRLKAIQSVNITYKKIIQILRNDQKFHEPILHSLTKDIEDQQSFICHIMYEGTPAIERLSELKRNSRKTEERKRKRRHSKTQWLGELERGSLQLQKFHNMKTTSPVIHLRKHYARETQNMSKMKNHLLEIEKKIKELQEATLSSTPEAIQSTLKQQNNWNLGLAKQISLNSMEGTALRYRSTNLCYGRQVLRDDFCSKSQLQGEYEKHLKRRIAEEEVNEQRTLNSLKQHSNVAVVLRCFLWNIFDILRHVHVKREVKAKRFVYPQSYMKLPLLKYECLQMRAVLPKDFEEDTLQVLNTVTHKLTKLMSVHDLMMETFDELPKDIVADNKKQYCSQYLESGKSEDFTADLMPYNMDEKMSLDSPKNDLSIPSRKHIKDLSSKIVETSSKRDE